MDTNPPVPRYSIDELAALVGLTRRTVRYYIQLGLVERPIGETRAAYYTPAHLEQLLTVAKYSKAGLALDRIADLLSAPQSPPPVAPPRVGSVEVRSHLTIADGVELVVEAGRAGLSPDQVRNLFREVLAAYGRVVEETNDER
jgi:DNA-binding transcriptional MerR regulator